MKLVINKKATHEFDVHKTFTAGIVLTGPEVKSLRKKAASLKGSFVKPIGSELFLVGAQINPYSFADNREYDPTRSRKLLLKKKEINQLLEASSQKGWSLVPLSFDVVGRRIKLEVGLARGKKQYEKRAELKKRAQKRDVEREMKKARYY
jgi:SsrA-binding protein